MERVFAAFVDVTVNFLESSFKQDPRSSSSPEDFFSGSGPDQPEDDKQNKLKAAYEFVELEPPVSPEELKKNYKKLSLRYHPDRNGGSKESQEKMQMLNACMDLIEKDIAGVTDDTDNDDDVDAQGRGGTEDEQEEPRERYMRMRREMEEEMAKEMKRQQEMREQFEANKILQKKECQSETERLQLDTPEGRDEASKHFTREVAKIHDRTPPSNVEKEEDASISTDMDGIDEHDQEEQKSHNGVPGNKGETDDANKPRNQIMDCNADDIVVALRMGMPDIAISVLQIRLKTYFREAALNMHFEGVKKTQDQVCLDFLLEPLDLDGNSVLHYAVYYESHQAIQIICQVAHKDRNIDPVISQENCRSQTPLFFAEIAEDESVVPLVTSQIRTAESMKEQTQFLPALKAGGRRMSELVRQFSTSTALSTASAFYVAHAIFDLHALTSFVGLATMQYSYGRSEAKNNADVTSVTILLSFCALWKFAAIAIAFVFRFIMLELALILAPIILAGLVSKNRNGIMGTLLLPFTSHATICRRITPVLVKVHKYTTPNVVKKHGWVRLYFLSVTIIISFGLNHFYK